MMMRPTPPPPSPHQTLMTSTWTQSHCRQSQTRCVGLQPAVVGGTAVGDLLRLSSLPIHAGAALGPKEVAPVADSTQIHMIVAADVGS
jgi:hypothetical protein